QELHTRSHVFRADVGREDGSTDSAPSPHDYFDSALASCKALTAIWYAKRRGIPLERVATRVERDDHAEREGRYRLRVHIDFQGPLTDEQRALLRRAADNCPIHKLMTRAEIEIETVG
ncbi:MAG TPA: OsmC family protein, partial [Rhodanobacteraceae bacterium]|nr:OsmC family protein [Rhodanobacteraceae bacterium]